MMYGRWQYQALTAPVRKPDEGPITLDKWEGRCNQPNPRRLSQLPTAIISSSCFFVSVPTETVTIDKWFQPASVPVRAAPFTRIHETISNPHILREGPITLDKWFQPASEPVRVKPPLRIHEPIDNTHILREGPITIDKWFRPIEQPYLVAPPLRAPPQLFYVPVITETITLDKWWQPAIVPVPPRQSCASFQCHFHSNRVLRAGSVYYVDSSIGSDSYPGTEAEPWLTIKKGVDTADAGDIVYVKGSTDPASPRIYYAGSGLNGFNTVRSGEEGNPIQFVVYPGHYVQYEQLSQSDDQIGIMNNGHSYIRIKGFKFSHWRKHAECNSTMKYGIELLNCEFTVTDGTGARGVLLRAINGLTVTDCTAHDNGPGTTSDCEGFSCYQVDNGQFTRCDAWNNGLNSSGADGFKTTGYDTHGPCGTINFTDCRAWGNGDDGFDLTSDSTLTRCKAYNHQGTHTAVCGFKGWRRGTLGDNWEEHTLRLYNCIAYGNAGCAVKMSEGAALYAYNSTFSNNNRAGTEADVEIKFNAPTHAVGPTTIYSYIKNCCVTDHGSGYNLITSSNGASISNNVTCDYNLYYGDNTTRSGLASDTNYQTTDPRYEDKTNGNYKLLSGSGAINNGTTLSETSTDYDQHPRPEGSAYDIGAYEYWVTPDRWHRPVSQPLFRRPLPLPTILGFIYVEGVTLKVVSDSGAGSDSPSEAVTFTLSDVGSGSDAPKELASFTLADVGSGADLVNVIQAVLKVVSDLGGGADAPKIAVSLKATDAGGGADAPKIAVSFVLSDVGHGSDLVNVVVAVLKTVADVGHGSDAIGSVSVSVPVADVGQAVDLVGAVLASMKVSDLGGGLDAVVRFVPTEAKRVIVTFTRRSGSATFVLKSGSASFSSREPSAEIELP